MLMFVFDFLTWWYGPGWILRFSELLSYLSQWSAFFSLGTLLKTLFKPWKQIVTTPDPHSGLSARKNAFIDNLVSRFVGFFVRISVLIFALIILLFIGIIGVLYAAVWPLLPVVPMLILYVGVL